MAKVRIDQIDTVTTEFEGAGPDSRQVSIKPGGITEEKLGFSWETVEILASAFSYTATRSTYTLTTAASSNANVEDNAELLRNGLGGMDRVTTTSASGEWSLVGTTLSVHGDITASGDSYTVRYVVGTSSGASASGNLIWLGTVPQQPLQTESDYFNDTTLDPKWSSFDPGAPDTTTTVVNGELVQTRITNATYRLTGSRQTAPADNQFCITATLRQEALIKDFAGSFVMVAEDIVGSPTTASLVTCGFSFRDGSVFAPITTPTLEGTLKTDWDTTNVAIAVIESGLSAMGWVYARIFVDRTATTVTALVSADGRNWATLGDATWAAASLSDVLYIGIVGANNTGEDSITRSSMFRVDITSDPELPVGGFVGTSVASTFLTPRDVAVAPNSTLDLLGWTDRKAKLIKCEVLCTTVATVGAYTLAVTKDPNGTADNMLSAATFDLTTSGTLSAFVPTDVPLTSTADDLILDAGGVWEVSFVSDNAGLDAAGVYFQLTWLVL